jgi:hypothetical protein
MDEQQDLILQNLKLVVHIAKRFGPKNNDELQDLVQEGNLALVNATRNYNGKYKFSTYAWTIIYRAIARYYYKPFPILIDLFNFDVQDYRISPNFLIDYDDGKNTDNLTVLMLKTQGYTFKEIGEKFGKDYHWASSRYDKGIKYIRGIIND